MIHKLPHPPSPTVCIMDIWGGSLGQQLIARKVLPDMAKVLAQLPRELIAGFLVNIRAEHGDWPDDSFDSRIMN